MIKIFKFQIIHICSNQAVVTRVFCSVLRMYWDGMMCSAIASDRYSSTFRDNEVECRSQLTECKVGERGKVFGRN